MKRPVVIYHDPCLDGFCSAFVAHLYFKGEVDFMPVRYGAGFEPKLEDIQGRDVYVFDFSFPSGILTEIREAAASFVLYDHHATSEKLLQGQEGCVFDQSRSGAQMAWDFFFPDEPRPWWVDYVADRDLWTKQLVGCDDVYAYLSALPLTVQAWTIALQDAMPQAVIEKGRTIRRAYERMVEQHHAEAFDYPIFSPLWVGQGPKRYMTRAAFCTSPQLISELGHKLALDSVDGVGLVIMPFAHYLKCSLRSAENGPDVAVIAEGLGGGGHPHAAGFEINHDTLYFDDEE